MTVSISFDFRVATPADAPRIAALHADSWRNAYRGMLTDKFLDGDLEQERTRLWLDRMTTPKSNQRVVLAESKHRLAGFACAFGSDDPELGTLLDNLHVSRKFQHRGVGAKLMSEIVSWCQAELPGEGLFLWVLEPNLQARRFYEHLGADKVGEDVWPAPDGGAIPSLCYAWKHLEQLALTLTLRMTKNR